MPSSESVFARWLDPEKEIPEVDPAIKLYEWLVYRWAKPTVTAINIRQFGPYALRNSTTGWVGGKYQNTYSDGYGGTTGTIGNKRVNTYEDGYGNTTGTIGRDPINLHTDPSGVTTGTIGRRRLNCYTDWFRTTACLHRSRAAWKASRAWRATILKIMSLQLALRFEQRAHGLRAVRASRSQSLQ